VGGVEPKGEVMTERDRRTGSGGTEDNVRDELDEAAERGRVRRKSDTEREVVEDAESDATGGVRDNVEDELDESQRRS
jgi:hypothetical protein